MRNTRSTIPFRWPWSSEIPGNGQMASIISQTFCVSLYQILRPCLFNPFQLPSRREQMKKAAVEKKKSSSIVNFYVTKVRKVIILPLQSSIFVSKYLLSWQQSSQTIPTQVPLRSDELLTGNVHHSYNIYALVCCQCRLTCKDIE